MQTYTVHEPSEASRDKIERAEQLTFVKDGFSLPAALLAPLWLLANRLWLALAGYVGAIVVLELLGWVLGLGQPAIQWLIFALHLLIGFEADSIRRWTLARNGYTLVGSVTGRSGDECERRFFEGWLKDQPLFSPTALARQAEEPRRGTGGRLTSMALWQGR